MTRKNAGPWGTILVFVILSAVTLSRFYWMVEIITPSKGAPVWAGWSNVDKMFIFGDSWSDTHFDLAEPQPGPDSPFGNSVPSYPDGTAVYGAHWFMYMTTEFNRTYMQTYNFARSSGTVNDTITPHGTDFGQEMEEGFLPAYGASGWEAASTLFGMFFGVNDINLLVDEWIEEIPVLLNGIFGTYSILVEKLYQNGARNFLFINLPPMERAPTRQEGLKPIVQEWNLRLQKLANNISNTYKDSSVFLFDLHTMFGHVIDHPTAYPQTIQIKNTTENCAAYGWLMPGDYHRPECGVPLQEYLWINELHPTYPLHEAMAAQIVEMLEE